MEIKTPCFQLSPLEKKVVLYDLIGERLSNKDTVLSKAGEKKKNILAALIQNKNW